MGEVARGTAPAVGWDEAVVVVVVFVLVVAVERESEGSALAFPAAVDSTSGPIVL